MDQFQNNPIKKLCSTYGGTIYTINKEGKTFILKMLNRNESNTETKGFNDYMQQLSTLKSPGFANPKSWGFFKGRFYILMKQIKGSNLQNLISKTCASPINSCKILYLITKVLINLREQNFYYGHLRPTKIMVNSKNHIKLLPPITENFSHHYGLNEGVTGGSYHNQFGRSFYLPPEAIESKQSSSSEKSIVYNLGTILFYCLCGIPPYFEYQSVHEFVRAKSDNRYKRLLEVKPDLPKEIVCIAEKAMQHNPNQRYENLQEMEQDLFELYKTM